MRQNAFAAAAVGAYSIAPDVLAGFEAGNREGGMQRAREGKGTEG